ncbi:hypothetical protein VJ918_07630 [Adlercreutzia sp. R21]|uniref:ABC transporter permease n=1 Tax=Adlercreutzia wanghongyangiae TaxID=3111451 RepID=A0ABU6IK93_9ACTN|nr:hypothetical protein [Adlercreutzia sp. R21]MEC4176751.1 hypothetical protein [Adlercreutzia sp. R7]MEC4184675.1 hypothetical protein [Adlercreutzia sp. R21]
MDEREPTKPRDTAAEPKERSAKRLWDGLLIEHPAISVIGVLLLTALTCGAAVLS